jgi:hypothetical protein
MTAHGLYSSISIHVHLRGNNGVNLALDLFIKGVKGTILVTIDVMLRKHVIQNMCTMVHCSGQGDLIPLSRPLLISQIGDGQIPYNTLHA